MAKVEFRWLEVEPVKDLTEDWGIRITCGDDRLYPHKKPVLTSKDVIEAKMTCVNFSLTNTVSPSSTLSDQFMISFRLTDQAKKTLAENWGDEPVKALAVFVDGKEWGTRFISKADVADFAPHAGMIQSRYVALRIVEACKKVENKP